MDALLWQDQALSLLDQVRYPDEEIWYDCPDYRKVVELLGTPAIQGDGIVASAGAYGYALAALEFQGQPDFHHRVAQAKKAILEVRPLSQSLKDALATMDQFYDQYREDEQLITALLAAAVTVHRQDVIACRAMSRVGTEILPDEAVVILACQTGAFHSGVFGGPLGVLRAARAKGRVSKVCLCQGQPHWEDTRKIAHELTGLQIPTTLMPDSSAATLMARGQSDVIFVEAFSVAANGDISAPAGSYALAIAAYFHSIQVYAVAYSRTMDVSIPDGGAFPQEDAPPQQAGTFAGVTLTQEGMDAWATNRDTIPGYLLTGIITDKGICFPPYAETIPEKLASTPDKSVLVL